MTLFLIVISLLSAVFFSGGLVLSQVGLRRSAPLDAAAISVPTSAVMFLILSPVAVDWRGFDWHAVALFAAIGLVYPAAVTILNFVSNTRVGPALTGAVGNVTPIFAILLAVLLLGEAPHPVQMIGLAGIVVGMTLIASARLRSHPGGTLWVFAVPLLGAMFRGGVQPVLKLAYLDWPDAFAGALFAYLTSASVIWIARAVHGGSRPTRADLRLFAAVGICNGLALVTLYLGLSLGTVTQVAPLVALYPLFTMVANRVVLGDRTITPRSAAGIAVSVLGVGLLLSV
ncbi:DMT family transporter [Pseudooceanicola aestuarii]|uniref:DMT family transporter n=1 Tax=Pseudooceanicola aestuarii TaxID=2697319 RepID=UPI0013D83B60|nr:DMT family transporter [Pseudooceanicola aestuarii]